MTKRISLDTDGLFSKTLLYNVPNSANNLEKIKDTFKKWTQLAEQSPIYSGYREQTLAKSGLAQSKRLSQKLRENFDSMLVFGIGGSALGARTGLTGLGWTVPPAQRRRVSVVDNLDPIEFEEIWSSCEPSRTCYVIISKSGTTLETMTQASVVLDRLEAAGLDFRKHVVAVTDPSHGALRSWVQANQISALEIPSDVGGRYSVFTPVGLLPLAFAGIDIDAMIEGAILQFQNREIDPDRVAQLGQRLCELEAGGFVAHTLMPYSSKLKDLCAWFVQLWGESLGKKRKNREATGLIPLAATGATDQHSLLQLLMEGPDRIINAFIRIESWPAIGTRRPMMSRLPPEFADLSFAYGRSFSEILNSEERATKTALSLQGRPVYEIRIEDPSPASVGALLAFFMDLVVYTAAAAGINPFDQPGVELGKKILPDLLKNL